MAQEPGTGLFQTILWGAAAATTGTGVLTGGNVSADPATRKRLGAGGLALRRGGIIKPTGNAEFYVTQTNEGLIALAVRASYPRGALTSFYAKGGAAEYSLDYTLAYIDTMRLMYAQGEGLKGNATWQALSVVEGAGVTPVAEGYLDFEDYEFVCTFEGIEYGILQFEVNLSNKLKPRTNGNTKAAGSVRLPVGMLYGDEELTVRLNTDIPIPESVLTTLDDCMDATLGAVFTGTNCDGDVVVITLTNLIQADPTSFAMVAADAQYEWQNGFMGDPYGGSFAWSFTPAP